MPFLLDSLIGIRSIAYVLFLFSSSECLEVNSPESMDAVSVVARQKLFKVLWNCMYGMTFSPGGGP